MQQFERRLELDVPTVQPVLFSGCHEPIRPDAAPAVLAPVDVVAQWGEIMGRGDCDCGAATKRDDRLHETLSIGRGADDEAGAVILEGAGHDLRGAGAHSIHEHHQRHHPSRLIESVVVLPLQHRADLRIAAALYNSDDGFASR
jgi:hypothetical protein